jgi:hypothetical protein
VRRVLVVLALFALAAPAGARPARHTPAGLAPAYVAPTDVVNLGRGAWSYFGDARSITHGTLVFTGWVSTGGDVWVAQTDTDTLKTETRMIYRNLGVDDHNNPSLVFWKGRLVAFFSEHSGVTIGHGARMRYRVANADFDIGAGFGPVRDVGTNTRGGLGYTYPNPVRAGGRLFLFWRGGDWDPTFTTTRDLRHWRPARTLVNGPGTRADPQRPYTKYAEGDGGTFTMVMSDGHVQNQPNSLYFMRFRGNAFYTAAGRRIGALGDVPFERSELDTVYRFAPKTGRAWPHDVAEDATGAPVVAMTLRRGGGRGIDHFAWARFNGRRWVRHELITAGAGAKTFFSGGMTVDHEDPSRVVLSRTIGAFNQVELWNTDDRGSTWTRATLTDKDDGFSMRPVIPRGSSSTGRTVVVYFHGTADSFTDYHTGVSMLLYDP